MNDAKTIFETVSQQPLRPSDREAINHRCSDDERALVIFVMQWRAAFPDRRCFTEPNPDDKSVEILNRPGQLLMEAYNWGVLPQQRVDVPTVREALHTAANVICIADGIERNPERARATMAKSRAERRL